MKTFSLIVTLLILASCSSSPIVMEPIGMKAALHFTDNQVLEGELIVVNDSSLFILKDTLCEVHQSKISYVSLDIDESRGWMINLIAAQALPSIIFILNPDEGLKVAGYTFLGLTVLTWYLFESSSPETDFTLSGNKDNLDKIRLYCRYPHQLSEQQIEMLKNLFRNNH